MTHGFSVKLQAGFKGSAGTWSDAADQVALHMVGRLIFILLVLVVRSTFLPCGL